MEMTTTGISKSISGPIILDQKYLWVPMSGPGSILILFVSVILTILRNIHIRKDKTIGTHGTFILQDAEISSLAATTEY